jgi:hypothetical protein
VCTLSQHCWPTRPILLVSRVGFHGMEAAHLLCAVIFSVNGMSQEDAAMLGAISPLTFHVQSF